jgi:ribosomal protein S18 acetylase RimI-like enzyme
MNAAQEDEIRLACAEDAAEVTRLMAAFRDFYDDREPPDALIAETVAELLADPSTEFLLAGRPAVAVAQLRYRLSLWTGTEDAWLEDLFVAEQARGRGVGRAMVEACAERSRARGCKRLQLDTNETNAAALALYERAGFVTAKRAEDEGRDLYLTLRLG